MPNIKYQYKYIRLQRLESGLAFICNSEVLREVYNDITVVTNDFSNPNLVKDAFVKMCLFEGYNGRESWHNKFFPFVNFSLVAVLNNNNGSYSIIVDYPALPPNVSIDNTTTDVLMGNASLGQGNNDQSSISNLRNVAGTGIIEVFNSAYSVAESSVKDKLVSIPNYFSIAKNVEAKKEDEKKEVVKSNWQNLLVLIIVILLVIAFFKYIVK